MLQLTGVEHIFDIARQTVTRWIATPIQKLPKVKDILLPASVDDVLELDEIWSFVLKKDHPRGCGWPCADEPAKW